MKQIVLDLTGVKTYWQLHERFKEVFRLPDYYGRNMDALWDCLNCYYDEGTVILVKNCGMVSEQLQPEIELMREVFRDLQRQDGVEVRYEEERGAPTKLPLGGKLSPEATDEGAFLG